jgi:transcriptional regulator with XRE-family HTH domain
LLSKRLEQLRSEKGMSQAEVAKILHMTQQAIDNYERGVREPKGGILVRLAQFYNVTLDYLYGLSDNRQAQYDPSIGAGGLPPSPPDSAARAADPPAEEEDDLVILFRARAPHLTPKERKMIMAILEDAEEDNSPPVEVRTLATNPPTLSTGEPAAVGVNQPSTINFVRAGIQALIEGFPISAPAAKIESKTPVTGHTGSADPSVRQVVADAEKAFRQRFNGKATPDGEPKASAPNGAGISTGTTPKAPK